METINDRFKQLRKACNKTQDEFAEIFGMTRSGICDIEKGRNNVTEKHLIMLSNWHERKINIDWLRTGEGGPDAMFLPQEKNDLIEQATAILGEKDLLFETFVDTYSKLNKKNRETLLTFFTDFSEKLLEKNQTAATSVPYLQSDKYEYADLKALSAAVKEAESEYIKSRSATAKKTGLSASNTTEGGGEAINQ